MSKKTLYLVDGTALYYRSFFALKLSTSSGRPVGAVYGFYRTLKKIISKYGPDYIGMCFDVSRKTFRQEKFKEYKINRPALPDDLKSQIPLIKKLVTSLGIKIIEKKGFEADDVIASLCQKAKNDGLLVAIVSPDKDLCQLIEADKVRVYNYNTDKFVTKDDFLEEYGFEPELMVDYLSLAGDSTDNIPGAKGIGKVGAVKLIKEFGSVENIFKNLDKITPKTQKILIDNKKMIILSRELVQLANPQLEVKHQDLKIGEPDSEGLYQMFRELEFKAFLKEIPAPALNLDLEVKDGLSEKALEKLASSEIFLFIQSEDSFVFDKDKKCVYKISTSMLTEILENGLIKKISYGFKDQLAEGLEGIKVKGLFFDVKIAAYLLESALPDYTLATLVSHYLAEHFPEIPAVYVPYFVYQLYRLLSVKLQEEALDKLFYEVEMPLVSILSKMQKQGVRIQIKTLKSLYKTVDKKCDCLKGKIFKIVGKDFNLNSPKQLAAILFDDLGITPLKKTKTGYSTNEEVLDELSLQYPIAGLILEYRHLNKLKTTYILPLIEQVEKNKGVLHTQFNQTGTQTGRLSSSSPNLQSIPVKGEFSQTLREAFIPSSDSGYILCGDYSQIELRILAHLSGDENLIQAFDRGLDIHSFTAGLLFGIKSE
ncbi:MAG: DNA polymerase I, partial [Candidatus Omnitrophica bacterium]|nr:DNA polymerase I [Candidatus Omnitrophota bacterium]